MYSFEKGYIEPQNNQIISCRKDKVLSYYGDNIWDLSPYSKEKTNSIVNRLKIFLFNIFHFSDPPSTHSSFSIHYIIFILQK